jgi:sortase A
MSSIDKSGDCYLAISPRETKNQRHWWKVARWIERIALTGGLGLLAIVGVSRFERAVVSQAALKAFSDGNYSASFTAEGPEAVESLPGEQVRRPAEEVAPAQIKEISTGSGTPLAVLEIPKIHLEVPVFNGTDDLTLNHAVGRIAGTARLGESGNIGIAGHRDTFFRGLKDVRKGDVIELKTREGKDRYIVDEIQIVTPDNVGVLRPRPNPSVTLVTCYPFYFVGSAPQRYVVMASLIGEQRSGPVQ